MSRLSLSECFARYGATLRNVQWAVSDVADGRLVVSLHTRFRLLTAL